jgi:hypothetical protein
MFLDGACICIDSAAGAESVSSTLRSLTADGPFAVAAVEPVGVERHRCTFELKRPGLAVGYRSLIDLQHRVDRDFHIVSVEPLAQPSTSRSI